MSGTVTKDEVLKQFRSRRKIAEAYVSMAGALRQYKRESHEYFLMLNEYEEMTGIKKKDLYNWRRIK